MADSKVSELSVASALSGAELFYGLEGTTDVKISPAQFAKYIAESFSFNTSNTNVNTIAGAINNLAATGTNISSLLLSMHPVGSLYWSNKNTSPASLFGGTWTQIKDRFVLAAGDSYSAGATGGAATHTLTVAEMPSHNHGGKTGAPSNNISGDSSVSSTGNNSAAHTHSIVALSGSTSSNGSHTHRLSYGGDIAQSQSEGGSVSSGYVPTGKATSSSSGAHTHTVTTKASTTGGISANHTHSLNSHTHSLQSHTHTISSQGSGSAHNNMPPYVAKYCWERTA